MNLHAPRDEGDEGLHFQALFNLNFEGVNNFTFDPSSARLEYFH